MAQEKAAKIIDLNAPCEALIPGQSQLAGDFLAAARCSMGASLAAVSAATNVKIEHLEAIEASNASALPATVYAVGFVKVYAKFLELDAEAIAKQFKIDIGVDATAVVAPIHDTVMSPSPYIGEGAQMVSIFGIIAILIFVFWIVVQITGNPGDGEQAQLVENQPVRLGAVPETAPELHPRSSVPTTVTVTRPAADKPVGVAPSVQVTPAVPNKGLDLELLPPQSASEASGPQILIPSILAPQVVNSESLEPVAVPSEGPGNSLENPEMATMSDLPELSEVDISEMMAAQTTSPVTEMQSPDVLSQHMEPPTTVSVSAEPLLQFPLAAQEAPEFSELVELPPQPVIVNAELVRSIAPKYPNQCTRNSTPMETVTILFDVAITGRASNVRVVQTSNSCFNNAAMLTLRRWRFDPKTVDGTVRPDIGKQATLHFRR